MSNTTDPVVIVGAARTPMGSFQSDFASQSAHDLGAFLVQRPTSEIPTHLNNAYIFNEYGHTVVTAYRNIFNIVNVLYKPESTDDKLHIVAFYYLGAYVNIAFANGFIYHPNGHVVCQQFVGIDIDLVLFDKTTYASYLRDAFDGIELIADIPVLDRSQLSKVVPFAFNGIPENLAKSCGIGAQSGYNIFRQ